MELEFIYHVTVKLLLALGGDIILKTMELSISKRELEEIREKMKEPSSKFFSKVIGLPLGMIDYILLSKVSEVLSSKYNVRVKLDDGSLRIEGLNCKGYINEYTITDNGQTYMIKVQYYIRKVKKRKSNKRVRKKTRKRVRNLK